MFQLRKLSMAILDVISIENTKAKCRTAAPG
jgi:hypothetical protein